MTMSDSFVDWLRYNDRAQFTDEQVRNAIYHEVCQCVASCGGQSCFDLFLGMTEMFAERMIGLSKFDELLGANGVAFRSVSH